MGATEVGGWARVAAPEGLALMNAHHRQLDILTPSAEAHPSGHGYIIPGLGDAGDKIFGTRHN